MKGRDTWNYLVRFPRALGGIFIWPKITKLLVSFQDDFSGKPLKFGDDVNPISAEGVFSTPLPPPTDLFLPVTFLFFS